jgi:O-methyltransferase
MRIISLIIKDLIVYYTLKKKLSFKKYLLLKKVSKLTMTSIKAQLNFIEIISYINTNKIKGHIVECGVYKGGNLILASELVNKNKKIYGYDTFEGHIENQFKNEKNIIFNLNASFFFKLIKLKNLFFDNRWNYASLDEVRKNLKLFSSEKNIKLIKGDVTKTLKFKKNLPKKISILRLDVDWYEPTLISLKKLYPLISNGGVLIIDDYGFWSGARKAIKNYFKNKRFCFFTVDHSVIYLFKT